MFNPPKPTALGIVMLLALTTVSCGEPPWKQAGTAATPAATVSASPASASPDVDSASPTPTGSPAKKAAVQRNDLIKGSTKRRLTAGGIALTINYYSTLSMAKWTPEVTKPLTVAASGKFADGSKQDIFLSNVEMRIDVSGVNGALAGPDPLNDEAGVSPGYLVKAPNAYGGIFSIPALSADATSVTLNVTYDLLAPSTPKSKIYAKQSASDTLVIALAS